jgi:hypothetical protein
MAKHRRVLLLLATLGMVLGCNAGPRKYPVSGTVTLDGKPVDGGFVYFIPLDPSVSSDAGKIEAGLFHFEARDGKVRVEIRASREVPGKRSPMGNIRKEEYIPARYNRQSQLEAEVLPRDNVYEFQLTSSPK